MISRFRVVKHYRIFLTPAGRIRASLSVRNFYSHSQTCWAGAEQPLSACSGQS